MSTLNSDNLGSHTLIDMHKTTLPSFLGCVCENVEDSSERPGEDKQKKKTPFKFDIYTKWQTTKWTSAKGGQM